MSIKCQNEKCGEQITVFLPTNDAQTIKITRPKCHSEQEFEVPEKE